MNKRFQLAENFILSFATIGATLLALFYVSLVIAVVYFGWSVFVGEEFSEFSELFGMQIDRWLAMWRESLEHSKVQP